MLTVVPENEERRKNDKISSFYFTLLYCLNIYDFGNSYKNNFKRTLTF